MIERIEFPHFFMETKNLIEPRFMTFINPYTQAFFKSDNIYLALTLNTNSVYVNMMVGKGDNNKGLRDLIKSLKENNTRFLRFGTYSKNERMISLFKYMEASFVKQIDDYYSDHDAIVEYELDLDASSRFNKV
jgi:hypothetical protein